MWNLELMTIFINQLFYMGYFSSPQYGIEVLQPHPLKLQRPHQGHVI